MKLCPHCDSDMLEKKNFFGIKIAICILLALIPFGIFICGSHFCFLVIMFAKNVEEYIESQKKLIGENLKK